MSLLAAPHPAPLPGGERERLGRRSASFLPLPRAGEGRGEGLRAWRTIAALAFFWALDAAPAAACSVCYGSNAIASPLVSGARLGVFLLLGITVVVLGGFAKFFLYLRHRALQAESDGIASEWAQLQRSSLR